MRRSTIKITITAIIILLLSVTIFAACNKEGDGVLTTEVLWTNNNIGGVQNGPENDTVVVLEEDCLVTTLTNYHYFNDGAKPGTITLVGEDGTKYGPWQASGREGQGGVKDAYWDTSPNQELKAGKYLVIDSDHGTWSKNEESGNAGFTEVIGVRK